MQIYKNMKEEEIYMQRCIQLALNGKINTPPNPMVGAVIVCDGKIIGEGYHIQCGKEHAEVNAIRSVADKSLLQHSTIYVTLEPCSHYGKTPPCADLIIEKKIPKVVIGCQDPFIKVAGRGIQRLREAGVDVITGVLEKECKQLISQFVTYHTLKRPYITLKWAESIDGFIDIKRTEGKPVKLSTDLTTMLVHKRRAESDAIMVGTQTALLDNPSLTVREWYGKNPVRIVLDKHLVLNPTLHLFDGSIPTLIYTLKDHADSKNITYIKLEKESEILLQIVRDLYEKGIQSLLVEGGSKLLQSFIEDNLWDDIFVEKSTLQLVSGVKAPIINKGNNYSIQQPFGVSIFHYSNAKN